MKIFKSIFFAILLISSCGVKGPPLPPVVKSLVPIENVRIFQKGDLVIANFSIPETYSDRTLLKVKKVRIYFNFYSSDGMVGTKKFRREALKEVIELRKEERNAIFQRKIEKNSKKFLFQVEYWDSYNKKSQLSKIFEFLVKKPLPPPKDLTAEAKEDGIYLRWEAEKELKYSGFFLYFSEGKEFRKINDEPFSKNEFVFKDFSWDMNYRFKVSGIYEKLYESEDSEEVSIKPVDIFPPPPPSNLIAIPEEGFILLKWENVDCKDFEKYNVYRIEDGKRVLLTSEGVKENRFEDRSGEHGKIYSYFVTAVDRKGNESKSSNIVEERYR
ncbi:MAG: fibronectin type III domain-containing protein [Candidatus Aminicenantia bacterium]